MVDPNPTDPTAYSTQSAVDTIFGDATTEAVIDQDQIDDLLGLAPDAPAAPLSADEIAEMRRILGAATAGRWVHRKDGLPELNNQTDLIESVSGDLVAYGHMSAGDADFCAAAKNCMPRLLSALEALTAENARLTAERDMLRDAAAEGGAIVLSEEGRQRFFDAIMNPKPPSERMIAAMRRYKQRMGLDHDWYARHRLRVEAAHAAAKEDASDDDPLAILRSAYPAPRLDDGIDMALLGELCREEPDADAKREVGDMMRGLYAAMEDSPLSHPRYPDLVKMARESSKDGD